MTKTILILCLLILTCQAFAQTDSLTSANKPKSAPPTVDGAIVITHNAFAPIPAFSFDAPALIAMLAIKAEKLRVEPDFSIGFNGKPWLWNNWFRYPLFQNRKTTIGTGVNPGLFFKSDHSKQNENIVSAHRNLTGEIHIKYAYSKKAGIILLYRYNKAFDVGTLNGHSFDLSAEVNQIITHKSFHLNLKPQVFAFDSEGIFKGVFASATLLLLHERLPVMASYQGVRSIATNYLPHARYNQSASFIYIF
jgi:hypothetical protein